MKNIDKIFRIPIQMHTEFFLLIYYLHSHFGKYINVQINKRPALGNELLNLAYFYASIKVSFEHHSD